jgi:hypothetical protein
MKRFPILAVAAIILAGCGTTNNSGVKEESPPQTPPRI